MKVINTILFGLLGYAVAAPIGMFILNEAYSHTTPDVP